MPWEASFTYWHSRYSCASNISFCVNHNLPFSNLKHSLFEITTIFPNLSHTNIVAMHTLKLQIETLAVSVMVGFAKLAKINVFVWWYI